MSITISIITITTTIVVTNTLNIHLPVYKILLSVAQTLRLTCNELKNIFLTTEKLVKLAYKNIKEVHFVSPII
jgi:hypothetical protein